MHWIPGKPCLDTEAGEWRMMDGTGPQTLASRRSTGTCGQAHVRTQTHTHAQPCTHEKRQRGSGCHLILTSIGSENLGELSLGIGDYGFHLGFFKSDKGQSSHLSTQVLLFRMMETKAVLCLRMKTRPAEAINCPLDPSPLFSYCARGAPLLSWVNSRMMLCD